MTYKLNFFIRFHTYSISLSNCYKYFQVFALSVCIYLIMDQPVDQTLGSIARGLKRSSYHGERSQKVI